MDVTTDMKIDWDKMDGLVPAIVQDARSGRVLMLGYMNEEALDSTIESGKVTFWSRSRQCLWIKGETSGNRLKLDRILHDCDRDALLILANPVGPTCHRGTASCFEERSSELLFPVLRELEKVIIERKASLPTGSYTTTLFRDGIERIAQKLGEEAVEVIVSTMQEERRTVEESADLLYHLLVLLAQRGLSLDDVLQELDNRSRA